MIPSYSHGASEIPLIGQTIGNYFDETVAKFPNNIATVIRHQGVSLTYAELKQQVDTYAAAFIAMGFNPGDRVGIWSPNNIEWIITQIATAKAGLILVSINPAYRVGELEYALNKVGCRGIVTAESFKTSDYIAYLNELAPELANGEPGQLRCEKLPTLEYVIRLGETKTPGMFNFSQLPALATESARQQLTELADQLQFDDPINIQFTSGTTGKPKGATLTHHNVMNNGYFVGKTLSLTDQDKVCIPVPMYHCFGMVIGVLGCITAGATMVFPGEAFDPLEVLQAVHEEQCTVLHGVPTMFIAELDHPDFKQFDTTHLRAGVMAGAPCPEEVMRRIIGEMHMDGITSAYGMTELSPVCAQTDPISDSVQRRVTTVGRAQHHVECKIVDENNRIVPVGTPGEFCARGYGVMLGYWADEEKTAESIDAGGWMHTGDQAVMDEEGFYAIVGRIKDMIIRGGENIFPREIEEYLYTHESIQEVQVVGVPNVRLGEEVCAWIKLKEGSTLTEAQVKAFCKDKIAHYKIPKYVRFVDDFPMTVTGKIQKFLMRDQMDQEINSAK